MRRVSLVLLSYLVSVGALSHRALKPLRMSAAKDPRTVVVTGLGPVSGCGVGQQDFFDFLVAGKSSIGLISENFDPSEFPCQIGSEVPSSIFSPVDYFNVKKNVRSNDRYTHFAMAASKLALADAKLDPSTLEAERFGVIIGSAFGGMGTFEQETLKLKEGGPRSVSPFSIPALLGNTASGIVGIELGAKGPNFGVVSACASATHCLGSALAAIRNGEADVMIAGGSEAAITPLSYAGFGNMKAMNTQCNEQPEKGSRPFDADRAGFVMGEGAGVLVLESLEHAEKRGAEIYCELAGYGATCDAYHITSPAPDGSGLAAALEIALADGNVAKESVKYLNAHGTSTPLNDKFETMAIKKVFGDNCAEQLAISSTKGSTGHTLGAAGGLEAIVLAKVLKDGVAPPTINYETSDPECDLDYIPNTKRELSCSTGPMAAISDNLGFGGHNAAIIMQQLA